MKKFKNWKNWSVYRHILPNGECYIGITGKEPEKCWKNGKGYYGSFFEEMIIKYGWENIEHEILYTGLTEPEARYLKYYSIQEYRSYVCFEDCNGYNCVLGNDDVLIARLSRKSINKICKMLNID